MCPHPVSVGAVCREYRWLTSRYRDAKRYGRYAKGVDENWQAARKIWKVVYTPVKEWNEKREAEGGELGVASRGRASTLALVVYRGGFGELDN